MRQKSLVKILAAIVVIALGSTLMSAKKKDKKNDGFVQLFNGKNFDGWYLKLRNGDADMAQKVYCIENGMVHVFRDLPDSFQLNSGSDTHGLFYTIKTYSKFIFKFEYKWGKKIYNNFNQFQYDAGMYYHVYDDAIWPKGIEFHVITSYSIHYTKLYDATPWASSANDSCSQPCAPASAHRHRCTR